jgi:hypothetical protein
VLNRLRVEIAERDGWHRDARDTVTFECAGSRSIGSLLTGRWPSISLDPDQPLDDLVNCVKFCEAALGDHAVRGTMGFFKHCIGLTHRVPDIQSIRLQANGTARDSCYRSVTALPGTSSVR